MKNLYKIFGLKPFAKIEDIENAYNDMYKNLLNADNPLQNIPKLKEAQNALNILLNPETKNKYDNELKNYLDNIDKIFSYALQQIQEQNYTEAIKLLYKCLEFDSGDYLIYLTLGLVYRLTGNFQDSLKVFLQGLELNEKCYIFNKNIGDIYSLLEDNEKAEKFYFKAIDEIVLLLDTDKDNVELNELLAEIYAKLACYEEAKELYLYLIEKFPNNLNYRRELACILYELNEYSEAERQLKEVLKIDSEDAFSYFYLGLIYFKKNYITLASYHLRRSLELNPSQNEVSLLLNSILELKKQGVRTLEEVLLEAEPVAFLEGIVKWYNKDLGIGVISCNEYPNVILHYSVLPNLEDDIKVGALVRFGVIKDELGILAKDIEIIKEDEYVEKYYGTIIYLDEKNKIGLIDTNSGKKYFFNFADVNPIYLDKIQLGLEVIFEIKIDIGISEKPVYRAINLRIAK